MKKFVLVITFSLVFVAIIYSAETEVAVKEPPNWPPIVFVLFLVIILCCAILFCAFKYPMKFQENDTIVPFYYDPNDPMFSVMMYNEIQKHKQKQE